MIRYFCLIGILVLLFVAGAWHDGFPLEEMTTPHQAKSGGVEGDEKASLGARTVIIPTPVWVIGSYDKEGKPNVMTSSWVGICSSKPASLMTCLRKATYTHGNIMKRKAFTVNIASESSAHQAAYVGRVSGRNVNKFKKTGLTPIKSTLVDAPYIKEFPLIIECQMTKTVELGSHTMFIGEIRDVKTDQDILSEAGVPDIEKLKPFVFAPGSSKFYGIGQLLGNVSDLAKTAEKK
jgi:flavin reductase (DIM6/NTAB) family NADH-FMN oxidoreductase RutF